jgi:hypothetical protein
MHFTSTATASSAVSADQWNGVFLRCYQEAEEILDDIAESSVVLLRAFQSAQWKSLKSLMSSQGLDRPSSNSGAAAAASGTRAAAAAGTNARSQAEWVVARLRCIDPSTGAGLLSVSRVKER